MRRRRPLSFGFVFCAGCLGWLMPGCSSSNEEILLPVSGTAKVDGKPLTTGWVTFYPDEFRGNQSLHLSIGEINPDGTYELSTNGKPGAPQGFHKVVIAASKDPIAVKPPRNPDGTPWKPRWLVHEKYTKPETTDLRIEVVGNPVPGSYDLRLSK